MTTAPHDPYTGPAIVAPTPLPRRRGPRGAIVAAFAVLAVLAAVSGWFAFGPPSHADAGSGPSATSGSSGAGGAGGTSTAGAGGAVPAGYIACDSYWCPSPPACWGGLVVISGVASKPRSIACENPHAWQTFVAAPLPADDIDVAQDELLGHPDAAAICSAANLAKHSRDPTHTTGWDREPLPLQQPDGSWQLLCLAGPAAGGDWTGSIT